MRGRPRPLGEERPLTLAGPGGGDPRSWSLQTCDPTDAPVWTPDEPSRGQCAVTALVVHDLLGGQLLEAEVHHADGSPKASTTGTGWPASTST